MKFNEKVHVKKIKLYNPILDNLSVQAERKCNDKQAKNVLLDLIEKVGLVIY